MYTFHYITFQCTHTHTPKLGQNQMPNHWENEDPGIALHYIPLYRNTPVN